MSNIPSISATASPRPSLAPLAPPPAEDPGAPPTKEQLVQHLAGFINTGIVQWCGTADLEQLCISSHKQLLEMKVYHIQDNGFSLTMVNTYLSLQLSIRSRLYCRWYWGKKMCGFIPALHFHVSPYTLYNLFLSL